MIINRSINFTDICELNRPLSYEYDSNTKSVVLLSGYLYEIMYEKSKLIDTIDLRDNINLIPEIEMPQ